MSTISKLSIKGVRCFGPANEQETGQEINFKFPLTLIIGANGSGKTTIMECLWYATIGRFPPGVKGPKFVYNHSQKCVATVMLEVQDSDKNTHTVTHSMELTKKDNSHKFKMLKVGISPKDVGTHKSTIKERMALATKTMCDIMGVSEAILNNVIFCLQVDSSWPLDKPEKVKETFDAIFGITDNHSEKIKVINKFMKDLCQDFYDSKEYIEIRTDPSYHVVRIRNNAVDDMRSCCSEGERVLACLIIRIALSKIFKTTFNVLALDEPTKYLDTINKDFLVKALKNLVESHGNRGRRSRSELNFKLIIMTHDESLRDTLATLGHYGNYYRLEKSTSGKSEIRAQSLE